MSTVPKKAQPKKVNTRRDGSETRRRLLDAAEALMRNHGYAAVTTRRLGDEAGVTAPLVHYYFSSMDDLFINLYRRHAEEAAQRIKQSLDTQDVLAALWTLNSSPIDTVLHLEFMALGNHRKEIREEMAEHGERYRKMQLDILKKYLKEHSLESKMAPELILTLMASTGLLLALESEAGMSFGHKHLQKFIAELITSVTSQSSQVSARQALTARRRIAASNSK